MYDQYYFGIKKQNIHASTVEGPKDALVVINEKIKYHESLLIRDSRMYILFYPHL
jgi:hypothetical protein